MTNFNPTRFNMVASGKGSYRCAASRNAALSVAYPFACASARYAKKYADAAIGGLAAPRRGSP